MRYPFTGGVLVLGEVLQLDVVPALELSESEKEILGEGLTTLEVLDDEVVVLVLDRGSVCETIYDGLHLRGAECVHLDLRVEDFILESESHRHPI
jgi:hypothetical protein